MASLAPPPRLSKLACIAIKLRLDARDFFLLRAHRGWGDWTLVGGHVEEDEGHDWALTAQREAEEELAPLRLGADMSVHPLAAPQSDWGPVWSRPHGGGQLTSYQVRWYGLRFERDPMACLVDLPRERFLLVAAPCLAVGVPQSDISALLGHLDQALPQGLDAVPLSWPDSTERWRVSLPCRDVLAAHKPARRRAPSVMVAG
ncbi:MAG: NUDIX hydrolase [Polyangiales bacterium]